jgi:hypothetical protein
MSEEIFRFSVVRNPRAIPSEQLDTSVLRALPDSAEEDFPYHQALLNLKQQGVPRREIIEHAQQLIDDPQFALALQNLNTPLWRFAEQLYLLKNPSKKNIRRLADEIFGDVGDVVASSAFAQDRHVIADSLVLASVVPPPAPGLRTKLMQARRAIAILEHLAPTSAEGDATVKLEKLLQATILLPSDLFPIPNGNKERDEKNRKEYDRRKEAVEQERQRAQDLLDRIANNEAAARELSATLSEHLFESKHRSEERNSLPSTLSLLPQDRFRTLSELSQKIVLEDLRMPAEAVDVAYAVDRLEKINTALNSQLGIRYDDLLLDAGPFYFPPVCGECHPIVLPEPKPENNFTPDTRGKVEIVGTQDLLIVRQSLLEYRPGEIAHIENILKGEQKSKRHRKLHRTEVTLVEETEREEEVENELQTADKYELQTESSRVINEDRSADAGVTVTASYGSVDIEAHGNYAQSSSTSESRSAASTFARDVINRSLQRIRERIMTRRSRTEITEVEIINEHQFDNTTGDEHIAGIYRWVDKYYEAQIVNYGKRTMLEFMIPEPAAFYKFAASNKPTAGPTIPKPDRPGFCRNGVFYPLTPSDLQPENYMCFVGKYNVKNVAAPSPRYMKVSDLLKYKIDSTGGKPVAFAESNDSFKTPEGYLPKAVNYSIAGGNSHSATTSFDHDDIILAVISIGDQKVFRYYKNEIGNVGGNDSWPDIEQVIEWGRPLSNIEQSFGSYSEGSLAGAFAIDPSNADPADNPHVVKVSLTGHTTLPLSVTIHYSVLCERSAEKFQQWQIDTYNAIQEAYLTLKQEYDSAQQSDDLSGFINIQGRNPLINREVEKKELKKFAISLLTGQQFESFNAMEEDYALHIPQINLLDAAAEGTFVRFFEQALEWKHMTYLFYPYFWGNKKHWVSTMAVRDTDPLFEQFLQAGYARVWVPVRPGFDLVLAHYIECGGEPWTEKDAPICGHPDAGSAPTVAMIEEIKEQLGADFEFREGTLNVRKGQTLVSGNGTDFRADDVNREILILLKYYRIAEVDEDAQKIQLREAYTGDDRNGVGFAVGVKFVGEPWVVQVPTDLVFLESGNELITR